MTRRIELGPILVAAGSLVLLVSLFLDWYGADVSAWDVFEVVDLLLAALAIAALLAVVGMFAPDIGYVERRWLPALAVVALILVAASVINPPPAATGRDIGTGAWVALGSSLVMLVGAILSLGRISFSVAVEGRETRERVSAVDERQPTTETAAVMASRDAAGASRRGRSRAAATDTDATQRVDAPAGTDEG
jgi:hypothetical protein